MNGVTWLQRGRGSKEKYTVIEKQSVQSTLLYKHSSQKFRSPNSECLRVSVTRKETQLYRGYVFHGRRAQSGMRNEVAWHVRAFDAPAIYRVSQEEWTKLRESVPYVDLYRYNPKHLYPKLNGYGDNGQRSLKL